MTPSKSKRSRWEVVPMNHLEIRATAPFPFFPAFGARRIQGKYADIGMFLGFGRCKFMRFRIVKDELKTLVLIAERKVNP